MSSSHACRAMGVNMYKQQLSKIFSNPFYCGLVSHGLLEGKIVEGIQEKMISKEEFLQIHQITLSTPQYGVSHQKRKQRDTAKGIYQMRRVQATLHRLLR